MYFVSPCAATSRPQDFPIVPSIVHIVIREIPDALASQSAVLEDRLEYDSLRSLCIVQVLFTVEVYKRKAVLFLT